MFRGMMKAGVLASLFLALPARADEAGEVLRVSGFRGGLIVHVGCGDGGLIAALGAGEGRLVQGLDSDAENVARARQRIDSLGLAGKVTALQWSGRRLPYAENLINLLVVEDPAAVPDEEVMRVLAPNGAACVKRDGKWTKTVKPRPEGMDEWTHWEHGADGNPASKDTIVGPPRHLQWTDGPAWSKMHSGPRISALVTARGRLFCVEDETPTSLFNISARWVLIARDAFNGVVLWRRELPEWTKDNAWGKSVFKHPDPVPEGLILGVFGEGGKASGGRDATRAMVAVGDRLLVPLSIGGPLSALDSATGKVLRTYESFTPIQEVACAEGALLIGARGRTQAVDGQTGKTLWETRGNRVCVADGRAFVLGPQGRSIACVAMKDGRKLWEVEFDRAAGETKAQSVGDRGAFTGPLRAGAGIVLATIERDRTGQAIALSADDGRPLWCRAFGGVSSSRGAGPFFINGLVWGLDSGQGVLNALDPKTGQVKKAVPAAGIRHTGHHARCCYARATGRYIIAKERGSDFVDLASGEVSWNNWARGPCHRGVIPANGLLYAGQHSCRCYTEAALRGFYALAPARSQDRPRPAGDDGRDVRLVKGPAYGESPSSPGADADWPTYRHDPARSGSAPTPLPEKLTPKWSTKLSGRLTAPVVAGGRLYVAAVDRHTLHALDAETGKPAWRHLAGGRIDSPPTVHGGLVLLGCGDGWVTCLRAADGRLVWRFRAAPEERMVGSGGQLESAWPVHGNILVTNGTAYCVAGRSSFLDGGLYVHALDPPTGRLLHTSRLDGPWPGPEVGTSAETPNRGYTSGGALPDILVANDEGLYLRHLRFDRALQRVDDMQPNFYKSPRLSGGNRGGDHKYWDDLIEAPRPGMFTSPDWFHRSFFQNFPGLRLYCTTGLLDGSWHRRMYWAYGQVVGQYIVFRGTMAYAVQVFATSPREGGSNAGDGYVVYAGQTAAREESEKLFALRADQSKWRIRVPVRPVAMLLAGDRLLLAGPPDLDNPTDALAAVEGRKGGRLWAVATDTGRKEMECELDSPPVFDGLAAAGGRLYLSAQDGTVRCLGAP